MAAMMGLRGEPRPSARGDRSKTGSKETRDRRSEYDKSNGGSFGVNKSFARGREERGSFATRLPGQLGQSGSRSSVQPYDPSKSVREDRHASRSRTRDKRSKNAKSKPDFSPILLTENPKLEFRKCQHHQKMPMDFYSLSKRQFQCNTCVQEIQGTPLEAEMNALNVQDIVTIYQS